MNKERYWTFVCYPESLPEDWIEYLQMTGLEIAISPLHEYDINLSGELKKPHYHVLLCFRGPTTYNKVLTIIKYLNCTIPQRVLSTKGMIRYFTHKDNPEKYQYDDKDIKTLNGLDLSNFNDLTLSQVEFIKMELIKIIDGSDITEYCDFLDLLNNNENRDYFRIASNNTILFNTYITSRRNKKNENI